MNYIDNWFHFYDTTESFEIHREQGVINPDSICFLKETAQLYTQGHFFGICKERYEELEQLVLAHDATIKNILGIEGPSVNDGAINNLADLINFLDGFTDKDTLAAIKDAIYKQIDDVKAYLQGQVDNINLDIDLINSKLSTVNTRLDGHDTAISLINTTLSSHLDDYKSLKETFDTFKSYATEKFSSIDESINSINTSIGSLQEYFTELDEKFDEVENSVSECQAMLEDTQDLANQLESKFGAALADIEQFKKDVEQEIADLEATKGEPYGIAPLDGDAKISSTYLPSYVDDVLEYATLGAFPTTGESGKIYVALDTNLTYRWSGSTYVEISQSLALGETSTTAYAGDKGKKVTDDLASHVANTNNPHNVTKIQLGLDKVNNTSDADKPISTATQAALDVLDTSLDTHVKDQKNPHNVTKEQLGLDKVDNTSDAEKPASTQVTNLLATKVDKITGKGLSTNDYTNEDKLKVQLASSLLSGTSTERESLTNIGIGQHYFDTDLNADMIWNGTTWLMVVTADSWNVVR